MKEFHKRRIHKRREHVHWRNLSPKKETITTRSISQDYWLTSNRANFLVEWAVRIIFYEGISLRKKLSEKIARFSTQKIDPSTGVTMDWSRGWQGLFESLSLGYPILVWNKKSILNKYVGCAAVFWYTRRGFGPLPVCDHSQGGLLLFQHEVEYSFSGFIPTNKQTYKRTGYTTLSGVWANINSVSSKWKVWERTTQLVKIRSVRTRTKSHKPHIYLYVSTIL